LFAIALVDSVDLFSQRCSDSKRLQCGDSLLCALRCNNKYCSVIFLLIMYWPQRH